MVRLLSTSVYIIGDRSPEVAELERLLSSLGLTVTVLGAADGRVAIDALHQVGQVVLELRVGEVENEALRELLPPKPTETPVVGATEGTVPQSAQEDARAPEQIDGAAEEADPDGRTAPAPQYACARREWAMLRELRRRYGTLTPLERDIFADLAAGRGSTQTARGLGIEKRTIRMHRSRIMSKMGTRFYSQLIRFATQLDIAIDPPTEKPRSSAAGSLSGKPE